MSTAFFPSITFLTMTDAPLIPLAQYIIERFKQQGVKSVR